MKTNILKIVVMAAVIVSLAITTFQRNGIWVTMLSLWTDVAKKTPAKSRVHNNLGNCYMLLGDYFQAVEEYKVAIALDKNKYVAYFNIATSLENISLSREALGYYAFFCKAAPVDNPGATKTACERVRQLTREFATPGK